MAVEPVVERFRAWLRAQKLPVTPQRMAIAEVLLASDRRGNLSADDVARELGARGVRAGTATVYRALDVMIEGGFVVDHDFGEGFRRFERARSLTRHEHLLCTSCGAVEDVDAAGLDDQTALIAQSHGFARERHWLVIYGLCAACRGGDAGANRA